VDRLRKKELPMASAETRSTESSRVRRYRKAAELLGKWMKEEGSYDEQTWPSLERELKDSGTRCEDEDEASS